jgi:hypothetical protein
MVYAMISPNNDVCASGLRSAYESKSESSGDEETLNRCVPGKKLESNPAKKNTLRPFLWWIPLKEKAYGSSRNLRCRIFQGIADPGR